MTDEELEKIKTKKDKTIHIIQFAKMAEVNMIYYERDYYAVADAGAEKAYELLRQSLLSQKKVAIAKTVIGTNEKLLVLYPTKDGIIVKTVFYHDEIVAMPKPVPKMKLDKNELAIAKMLIENMTRPFVAEEFQDEYQARLREAIMKKIRGQEIVSVDTSGPSNVIDLMEALQKSLEQSKDPDKNSRKRQTDPFDDPDYIYELKMLSKFPEVKEIFKNVRKRCILDGEVVVLVDGVPDFYRLQKRTLLTDRFKIELEASRYPG